MWKKIEGFILQKSSDYIGIDIGTSAIKLAEIAWQNDKPVLKNFGMRELPEQTVEDGLIINPQQLSETLNQLLSRTHTKSKNVVMAVGGRIMFARELIFPAMTMEELGEAIKWDLEKYIPYAPGTYYFDYSIVGQGNTETEIKVLLVASPLDHVRNLIDLIKRADLKLMAIDVEPLALYRIFADADEALVIDIGALLSQVTIFHNGSPAVIRNIPIGGEHFTNAIMKVLQIPVNEAEGIKQRHTFLGQEETLEDYAEVKQHLELLVEELARDVRRTADYFRQQNKNVPLNKVFITGGGAKLGNLVQTLGNLLGMPVVMYDPLAKVEVSSSFDKAHLAQAAPHLGIAIGLALRGGDDL